MKTLLTLTCGLSLLMMACETEQTKNDFQAQTAAYKVNDTAFKDYWYQGKAELNTYEISQNRYNDLHPGEVIAIFVTEDFLTDKQVKNDSYKNPNSVSILKTNLINRFTTGLYDYSIMTSTFTPVDVNQNPYTLKVTTSAQDWCGQAWMQINKSKQGYDMQLNSYFENEADKKGKAPNTFLEDEIMNKIRINPAILPTGETTMIASNQFLRLTHQAFAPTKVITSLKNYEGSDFEGKNLQVYNIKMPEYQRDLSFIFEGEAPFQIAGWMDTYPSAFDKKPRTSVAKRKQTLMEPYWKLNNKSDRAKRTDLGIEGI
ncbi:MAG: hypothetical protein Sapg2KO_45930 [Saprospiraceae bacterium]